MSLTRLRVLVVEDDPTRVEVFKEWVKYMDLPCSLHFVWAKTAGAAIGILNRDVGSVYSGIMLDHDLDQQNVIPTQGRRYTGRDVVAKILEVTDRDTPILVHSTNEKGGPEMREKLESAGFSAELIPFYALEFNLYRDWINYVCEKSRE